MNNNMKRIDLYMPRAMLNSLDKLADKTFEKRSNLIRQAIKIFLDEKLILEGIVDGK